MTDRLRTESRVETVSKKLRPGQAATFLADIYNLPSVEGSVDWKSASVIVTKLTRPRKKFEVLIQSQDENSKAKLGPMTRQKLLEHFSGSGWRGQGELTEEELWEKEQAEMFEDPGLDPMREPTPEERARFDSQPKKSITSAA